MNAIDLFINKQKKLGNLVVQPRMGFSSISKMKQGLGAVKKCKIPTIGTITLDSYTRVNDYNAIHNALTKNEELNGYPIVYYGAENTKQMLIDLVDKDFPIQVRHGTALPKDLFEVLVKSNIIATEGGPVSYCLPYSRVPLKRSIDEWAQCVSFFSASNNGCNHLETFGGCMLGQLCPPSLLVALSVLEGLFFKQLGISSISFSFAQGTSIDQDWSSLLALRNLINRYFQDEHTHIVLYTFMGLFPKTARGGKKLIEDSAILAKQAGIERLIVKTLDESECIPSIKSNIESLEYAFQHSGNVSTPATTSYCILEESKIILNESQTLIEAVLDISENLTESLSVAFKKGILDVPFCLHQDNSNKTRSFIDHRGFLMWENTGNLPIARSNYVPKISSFSSSDFLKMLSYVQKKYDRTEI